MKHYGCLLALPLALLLARHAAASQAFPQVLTQELGLERIPDSPFGCLLCHKTLDGGYKTVTKPFGRAVLQAGAMGGSVPSLLAALKTLETNATDSDHDGAGDIAELKAGTDPNVFDASGGNPEPPVAEDIPLPQTGCALSRGTTLGGSWAALLAVVSFLLRRRYSRRDRAESVGSA